MFSLEIFHKKHETEATEVVVNGRKFKMLLPRYLSGFINTYDIFHKFPLWAKIWQASWVLAGYLDEMPVDTEKKFLEIGAGVGLVSIVAATCGHQITMTEHSPDALQFARANAHINGCPHLPIVSLDWNRPTLAGQFDYIVASEVSYKNEDLQPLLTLFKTYLKPDGKIILAGEMRRVSKDFYKQMEAVFDIRVQKKVLRSNQEKINIFLFRMSFKNK
ncbi:MAG: methyltransferase domain-containing protein [Desulfobacterales bacterium]|nr:methyltransferase domain-containing protein [Desulfobacterales bacterium]